MENETRSTVGRIKCVQKLRSDFDEKRIIYKKELKGKELTKMLDRSIGREPSHNITNCDFLS